jgi:hypothetical protein
VSKVCSNESPFLRSSLSKLPSPDLMRWVALSSFFHVTVVPFATVTSGGLNAKSLMLTAPAPAAGAPLPDAEVVAAPPAAVVAAAPAVVAPPPP